MKKLIHLPAFEGVDDVVRIAPGDYSMKCTGCEQRNAVTSGDPMIVFTFVGIEGKAKGKQFKYYCSLSENVLWKLKMTLETLGVEIPDPPDEMDLNPDDVVDVEVIGNVEDHTYNGITSSRLTAIVSNEETPKKASPKISALEVQDMDEDELEGVVEKYNLDIELSNYSTRQRKARAVKQQLDEAGMLEETK
jgi:uncharacterized protein DUF669